MRFEGLFQWPRRERPPTPQGEARPRRPWRLRPGLGMVLAVGVLASTLQHRPPEAHELLAPLGEYAHLKPVPAGFLWGVATAGYQWEGGDRASNWAVWQAAGHVKEPVGRAADGWDRYESDLGLAQHMGLNAFRLSLEWDRIEPHPGQIDWAVVRHYHDVLDAARRRGLQPIVTLLHYTYPAWLDRNAPAGRPGWESSYAVDRYVRFVDFVSREFRADIPYYLTFNEPTVMIEGGYLVGVWPPGKKDLAAFLRAAQNVVTAHSRAYDVIHANAPHAKVSFNNYAAAYQLSMDPTKDSIPAPGDDWFLKAFVSAFVPRQKAPGGRPKLDYVAVDYYKRLTIPAQIIPPSPSQWHVYPDGFAEVLERYYKVFHLPILVAENGLATDNGKPRADGWTRERYLVTHIAQVQLAIARGVPMIGYTYWTLTDNYEWGSFNDRFGLYRVECRSGDYRRIPTPAVEVYRQITEHNGVTPALVSRYAGR